MLSVKGISNHIALNAILAGATQVASPVKPGNVHRYHDFKLTKMEHYLSSAVALNNPMFELATRGVLTERGLIDIDEVDMGWIIAEVTECEPPAFVPIFPPIVQYSADAGSGGKNKLCFKINI